MKLFSFFTRKKPAPIVVRGSRILRALVSQTGVSNPTMIVLENTIGLIGIERDNAGNYTIKKSGGFQSGKTFVMVNHGVPGAAEFVLIHNKNNGTLRLSSRTQQIHQPTDGLLNDTEIEIRIYD